MIPQEQAARFTLPRAREFGCALFAAALFALVVPSASFAAKRIDLDLNCYIVGEHPTVTVAGSGFAPGANMSLNLSKWVGGEKKILNSYPVTIGATGQFTSSFPNPGQDRLVTVTEPAEPDVELVTKNLRVTRFEAGYFEGVPRPGPTRVKDQMVLFASGFAGGQQGPHGSHESGNLFLHRVAPKGSAKTELISSLRTCGFGGTNRVTGRALFKGSAPVKTGKWKFQFDTSSKYKASTAQKIVLRLKVSKGGIVKPGEQTQLGKN